MNLNVPENLEPEQARLVEALLDKLIDDLIAFHAALCRRYPDALEPFWLDETDLDW